MPVTAVLLVVASQASHRAAGTAAGPTTAPSTSTAPGPVDVPAPPRSAAGDRYCPDFVAALPITLDGLHSRPAHSTSPWVGAWGDPAVTFRCGVPRPSGLEPSSALQVVNGVQWLYRHAGQAEVFTAVDRPVYVEITVPDRYSGGPLSAVTGAVSASLPAQAVDVH